MSLEPEDEAHLTPDLPPAADAPDLSGATRTHSEDDPLGRCSALPPPYRVPTGKGGRGDDGARTPGGSRRAPETGET